MLSNMDLYGTDDVPPISKEDANKRIALLEKRLAFLTSLPLKVQSSYTETKVIEAIRFWKRLSNQEDAGL
jgi:hypothetical protein